MLKFGLSHVKVFAKTNVFSSGVKVEYSKALVDFDNQLCKYLL